MSERVLEISLDVREWKQEDWNIDLKWSVVDTSNGELIQGPKLSQYGRFEPYLDIDVLAAKHSAEIATEADVLTIELTISSTADQQTSDAAFARRSDRIRRLVAELNSEIEIYVGWVRARPYGMFRSRTRGHR